MLSNSDAMRILEDAINRTNKCYIETNDTEVLSLLNGLFNLSILEGLSFTESVDGNSVYDIKLDLYDEREYPEDSYFRSLNKTLLMRRAYGSPPLNEIVPVPDTTVTQRIHAPIKVDNASSNKDDERNVIKIPMNVKKMKKKKTISYMITSDSYDKINPNRMAIIPPSIRALYEACGFRSFLKGKTVIHAETAVTGIVKSFCISGINTLVFTINRSDGVHTTWGMESLLIDSPVDKKPIGIMEYIKLLDPPTEDETIFNKERNQFRKSIRCSSFNDVPYKRLAATDKAILDLYKQVGYRNFLNGMTVYNGDEVATVIAFAINRNNKFEFRVKKVGERTTDWVMSKCTIRITPESERITIDKYISMINIPVTVNKQISMFELP